MLVSLNLMKSFLLIPLGFLFHLLIQASFTTLQNVLNVLNWVFSIMDRLTKASNDVLKAEPSNAPVEVLSR